MMFPALSSAPSRSSFFLHHSSQSRNPQSSLLILKNSTWVCANLSPESRPRRKILSFALGPSENDGFSAKEAPFNRDELKFDLESDADVSGMKLSVGMGEFPVKMRSFRMGLGDQTFFTLVFIVCSASVAFTGLIIAAIPTLWAMRRAAISFAKLADTARAELPSTMAAMRLSGMEISDLTLELSELSQEIADGVNKSAEAVQAAEAGIRKIGQLARRQTINMIEERANLPDISLQPVVKGAAKKTSRVFGQARKMLLGLISKDSVDD